MSNQKQQVFLAGIGMGTQCTYTNEVINCIETCDCIIGAKRMVESFSKTNKPVYNAYLTDEVKRIILAHKEYQRILIACSGDTGFYSGAKELHEALKDVCDVVILPGISAVTYLAARLRVSWEDAKLISIHGRKQHVIHMIARHKKSFLLIGGTGCAEEFCQNISDYGLNDIKVYIGKSLSYKEERILCKMGKDVIPEDLEGLAVLYIENKNPVSVGVKSISDDAFIRGKVPMTKEEVRTISISKLGLTNQSVLYDVGAGTGSVSVEAATMLEGLRVYAIEKNPEGIELIRKNQIKFYTDQINVVSGVAPDVLEDLEPPTHVFIGGSSGNLKEILACVRKKNADARVVLNAISLETMKEILEAAEAGLLHNIEIVQVNIAKAKELSGYHIMNGQNPIYIISERK